MKCGKVRSLLSEYRDGRLASESTETVRAHLDLCEACRPHRDELQGALQLLRALPPLDPDPDMLSRVRAMAELRDGITTPPLHRVWLVRLAYAAVVVVTAGVTFLAMDSRRIGDVSASPRSAYSVEAMRPLATHLDASDGFFRQVVTVDPASPVRGVDLLAAELDVSDLARKTDTLNGWAPQATPPLRQPLHVYLSNVGPLVDEAAYVVRARDAGDVEVFRNHVQESGVLAQVAMLRRLQVRLTAGADIQPEDLRAGNPALEGAKAGPRDLYLQGRSHFYAGRYGQAVSVFDHFLESYREDSLSDDVLFCKAECDLRLGKWEDALEGFSVVNDTSYFDAEKIRELELAVSCLSSTPSAGGSQTPTLTTGRAQDGKFWVMFHRIVDRCFPPSGRKEAGQGEVSVFYFSLGPQEASSATLPILQEISARFPQAVTIEGEPGGTYFVTVQCDPMREALRSEGFAEKAEALRQRIPVLFRAIGDTPAPEVEAGRD